MFPTVIRALSVGCLKTLEIFFLTLAGSLPLGLVICFGSVSRFRPLRMITRFVIWVVRGTPLMLQLIIIYYGPGLMGFNIWGGNTGGRMAATLFAFIFNYACYFSEIYRGGIQSVPKGQFEAGKVLGMTKGQIFRRVILAQVIKTILAPMSNEVITLVKDTALARVIGVIEIIKVADRFASKALIWPLFYAGAFYLAAVGILTLLFGYIEKKLSYYKV